MNYIHMVWRAEMLVLATDGALAYTLIISWFNYITVRFLW